MPYTWLCLSCRRRGEDRATSGETEADIAALQETEHRSCSGPVISASGPAPTHPEQGDALHYLVRFDPDEPVIVPHHAARTARDVLHSLSRSIRHCRVADADVELLGVAIRLADPRDWEAAGATASGAYPTDRAGIAAYLEEISELIAGSLPGAPPR